MRKLESFLTSEMDRVNKEGALFSLHMKATMMKVSDPILFGAAVRAFFKPVVERHGEPWRPLWTSTRFGDLVAKLPAISPENRAAIEATIAETLESRPDLAMVNSDKGITNRTYPRTSSTRPCQP